MRSSGRTEIALAGSREVEATAEDFGPAMSAVFPREREFIIALLEGKSAAQAAREAGYGAPDGSSTAETMSRIGYRLTHTGRVIDALSEQAKRSVRGLVPEALKAAREVLMTTSHKDRVRVAMSVLDRIDPPQTNINAHVEVVHRSADMEKHAYELWQELRESMSRSLLAELLGARRLEHYEKIAAGEAPIDAEFVEIDPEVETM